MQGDHKNKIPFILPADLIKINVNIDDMKTTQFKPLIISTSRTQGVHIKSRTQGVHIKSVTIDGMIGII